MLLASACPPPPLKMVHGMAGAPWAKAVPAKRRRATNVAIIAICFMTHLSSIPQQ